MGTKRRAVEPLGTSAGVKCVGREAGAKEDAKEKAGREFMQCVLLSCSGGAELMRLGQGA